MAKILYLMHVSWEIIKQRPHFIAEELSVNNQVDVYYKRTYKTPKKDLLTKIESNPNLSIGSYQILPFDKFKVFDHICLDFINRIWMRFQLPDFKNYDYIWVSSPYTYRFIKGMVDDKTKIVYDCMDDYPEFPDIPSATRNHMLVDEKELLYKSYKVFCTAKFLREKIQERAGLKRDIIISNNGIKVPSPSDITTIPEDVAKRIDFVKSLPFSLLYIGAISEWFDFELITKALDRDEKLHVVLIGPEKTKVPSHPRLHSIGSVERTYIFEFMKVSNALIMPFVVNDLIKSVNPVKLYEYIFTGKPVISVRYSETEYFKDFVNLYDGIDDFTEIVNKIKAGEYDSTPDYLNKCLEFISANTWKKRVECINEELK